MLGVGGTRQPVRERLLSDIVFVVNATRVGRSPLFRGPDPVAEGTPGCSDRFRQNPAIPRNP